MQQRESTTVEAPRELREDAEDGVPLHMLVDLTPTAAHPSPALAYGVVSAVSPLTVRIADARSSEGERDRDARRAKSCLVAATVGDRVLCSDDGERLWILAVLDGAADVQLTSEGALSLEAKGELGLTGEKLRMSARSARVLIEDLKVVGKDIEAVVGDRASLVAQRVEARASRFLQRAKQAFRFVEELEQVRARNIDMRAESLAAIRGETTIVAARVLAKLDGEQVKIG